MPIIPLASAPVTNTNQLRVELVRAIETSDAVMIIWPAARPSATRRGGHRVGRRRRHG